jgi:DNA invertase Pin-like site-specific DNA recombinase
MRIVNGQPYVALTDRNAEIYRLRMFERWTLTAIATHYALSHERVREIIRAEAYRRGEPYVGWKTTVTTDQAQQMKELRRQGYTYKQIADTLGVVKQTVWNYLNTDRKPHADRERTVR